MMWMSSGVSVMPISCAHSPVLSGLHLPGERGGLDHHLVVDALKDNALYHAA